MMSTAIMSVQPLFVLNSSFISNMIQLQWLKIFHKKNIFNTIFSQSNFLKTD